MAKTPHQITITAPNPAFAGVSAGVHFSQGQAIVLSDNTAALEYFARHRFGIDHAVDSEHDELKIEKQEAARIVDPLDVAAVGKLSHDEIDALFTQHGVPVVTEGKPTKSDKAAILAASIQAKPADVAGEGPAGPVHNQGHDGANPAGAEPQMTPADAGI